jgi:hypothetical protein
MPSFSVAVSVSAEVLASPLLPYHSGIAATPPGGAPISSGAWTKASPALLIAHSSRPLAPSSALKNRCAPASVNDAGLALAALAVCRREI